MALTIAIITGIVAPILGYILWKKRSGISSSEQYLKNLDENNKAIANRDETTVNARVDDYLNKLRAAHQGNKRGQDDSKDAT